MPRTRSSRIITNILAATCACATIAHPPAPLSASPSVSMSVSVSPPASPSAPTSLSLSSPAPPSAPPSPIDLNLARRYFDEARALSDADDRHLWGVPLYGPMLLVDPVTRAVVANVPNDRARLKPWRPTPDAEPLVYVGTLPPEVTIGNTTTAWADMQWTMIMWPLPGHAVMRGQLMMHECFHRIQRRLGFPLSVADNAHLDRGQARIWLRLEWRALARALADPAPLESAALHDAMIFRAYRHDLYGRNAAEEERLLELNEGLAEYTGLRLGGADADAQRRQAIAALASYARAPTLVRSFAYASGPPYCLLLDEARPRWRREINERSGLARLLWKSRRMRLPDELADAAYDRAREYDMDRIAVEEAERETARTERLAHMRRRFVDDPILFIELDGAIRYSFSPHNIEPLHGIGTVYGTLYLTGNFGILDAQRGALMVEGEPGQKWVTVPATDMKMDKPIRGDGWTLSLKRGWTIRPGARAGDHRVVRTRGSRGR